MFIKRLRKYNFIIQIYHKCLPEIMYSINLEKVAPALHKPKGIRVNSNNPLLVINNVFGESLGDMPT
jgi:hypothetical protein